MKISKKLRIAYNWRCKNENGVDMLQIINYDDGQHHEEDDEFEFEEIPDIQISGKVMGMLQSHYNFLLVFKQKEKPELVWIYDEKKAILYDTDGRKASKKDLRRFIFLLANAYRNS